MPDEMVTTTDSATAKGRRGKRRRAAVCIFVLYYMCEKRV
jgi:hypothetical protein